MGKEVPADSVLFESLMLKELDRATHRRGAMCAKALPLRPKHTQTRTPTQTPHTHSHSHSQTLSLTISQTPTHSHSMTPSMRCLVFEKWLWTALRFCLRMGARYWEVRSVWHCAKWCLVLLFDRLRRLFARVMGIEHK